VFSSIESPGVSVGGKDFGRRMELNAVEEVEGAVGVRSEVTLSTAFFCGGGKSEGIDQRRGLRRRGEGG